MFSIDSSSAQRVIKVRFLSVLLTTDHVPTDLSYVLFTGLFALQLREESVLIQTSSHP